MMDLKFEIKGRIQRPLSEVFDAVYNPQKLSSYFVTAGASGPLNTGVEVMWEFADFPGAFPVNVEESVKNEKIRFRWDASSPNQKGEAYKTTVEFNFQELAPDNTLVSISEWGWEKSEQGYLDSRGNSQGWMNMLTCMKAFVEHGINLRQGMFK